MLLFFTLCVGAADYKSLSWANICSGKMDAEWYGSDEARSVADTLLGTQKVSGGWMKNYQYHILSAEELASYKTTSSLNEHSCFDNYSTTQEMRFLAKVYNKTKEERYLASIKKALNLIFESGQGLSGGWGQYWPLSDDKYSYQNYITFNDDLMTNMLKMLQEINEDKGDWKGLFDDETKAKCKTMFDNAIQCVLKCQVDDNGTKAGWCAQHDPKDFLPTEGRPHELPSISGSESATLLYYLMTIQNPSKELQECITSAVAWFKAHKYMENAAIEDYTNASGVSDRHIVEKTGSNIWGRFIQIGGESGKKIFDKFVAKLKERGKKRAHHSTGHVYYEYQIAEASYDTSKDYQPIYAIYTNDYPELFYRYLYNYDDTPDAKDEYNQTVATSLMAGNRRSYQYLGSWLDGVISAYDQWKAKMDAQEAAGESTMYTLSSKTYASSDEKTTWTFSDGFSITNGSDKAYATGKNNTLKFSKGVNFAITIPNGYAVTKVSFYGYSNVDNADAYISKLNGTTYSATDYVFPTRTLNEYATHNIDLSSNPAIGTLPFTFGNQQVCAIITLYCSEVSTGISTVYAETGSQQNVQAKYLSSNQLIILKNGKRYNAQGQQLPE